MANKKINFKWIAVGIRLIVFLFLIGTLFIPFSTGLKMTVKSSGGDVITTYKSAFVFMFGGELISEHIKYKVTGNCVIGMVGYILIATALILLLVSLFSRRKKDTISRVFLFVTLAFALAGSILMLSAHRSAATILADAIIGEHSDAVAATIYKNTSLEFGFWGVGMFGIISSVGLLASLIFDGTVDKIRDFLKAKL